MAHARKKPPAKKPPATKTANPPLQEAPIVPANAPDVFDEAIATRGQTTAEAVAAAEPPATGFTTRVKRPDPFAEMTIAMCNDNEGPKARLYRNRRFQQMAIQFDEKPDEDIRQKLRDDGWTWRPAEGAWTKQLGEQPGQTHRKAQALFLGLVSEIRQVNGLEPVTTLAQGR